MEKVIDGPAEYLREYAVSKLNLYPRTFNVTGELVLSDPITGCTTINNEDEVKGKVALVLDRMLSLKLNDFKTFCYIVSCRAAVKQRNIHNAGGIGMIVLSSRAGSLGNLFRNLLVTSKAFITIMAENLKTLNYHLLT